ncbi:MAG: AraC family transcriptional regulator [Bacteroidales bacterium]|jgi:AraC-like DNA-binding protein|nr:AraC family transcriptional regulator [Bacteroidales bacterium]
MTDRLLFFTVFLLLTITTPLRTYAEETSDYEKYKQKSFFYFQQRNYELAYYYLSLADSIGQVDHQNELQKVQNQYLDLQKQVNQVSNENNVSQSEFAKSRKVTYGVFIFVFIDILGLFFFMYLQRQRTYMHLVKKNMEWAQTNTLQPDIDETQQTQQEIIPINQVDNVPKNRGTVNYKEQDLLLRFVRLFKEEKIHLKSDITIQEVALLLDTNKYTLSKIINTCFHKSFPALVNEYRIKEAINLLSNTRQSSIYTLEAIGEQSGFRSRQVFYMVFKKSTGVTPNDFRKMRFSRDFREEYGDPKT